jgi:hypothetical protein
MSNYIVTDAKTIVDNKFKNAYITKNDLHMQWGPHFYRKCENEPPCSVIVLPMGQNNIPTVKKIIADSNVQNVVNTNNQGGQGMTINDFTKYCQHSEETCTQCYEMNQN